MNRKLSPKLTTSYRAKFLGQQVSPTKPFRYINELLLSSQRMDLTTTKQEDYCERKLIEPRNLRQNRHRSVSPFRQNASSTYTSAYLDYGPIQKLPSNIVSTPMDHIKFMGTSSYADNFKPYLKLPDIHMKPPKDNNVLGAAGLNLLETTSQSSYQDYKDYTLSTPFKQASIRSSTVMSPMRTTYATSFNSVSPMKSVSGAKELELFN